MKYTIKRILCILLGHDWVCHRHTAKGIEYDKKVCERCYENKVDTIYG